jgi:aspartate aminotransferase
MVVLSKRGAGIAGFPTWQILRESSIMMERGLEIINMGGEEPDFPTPQAITAALQKAIAQGFTNYAPPGGIPELREAVVEVYRKRESLEAESSEAIITNGATQAIHLALLSLVDPGDEVLLPTPYWTSYPEMVRLAGAHPVLVKCREDFSPNIEALQRHWTEHTRGVLLSSPISPSGNLVSAGDLQSLAELCAEKGAFLFVDESYQHFVYPPHTFHSAAALFKDYGKHIVLAGSFSKTYAMAGWRIGYALAPAKLVDSMVSIQTATTAGPPTFCQMAALEALRFPNRFYQKLAEDFAKRKEMAMGLCKEIPNLVCNDPEATFYLFPSVKAYLSKGGIRDTNAMASFLLREGLTYVVPSTAFGIENHIRISFALPQKKLKEGFRRIGQALSLLT